MRIDFARVDDLVDRHKLAGAVGPIGQITRAEDDVVSPSPVMIFASHGPGETSKLRVAPERGAVRARQRDHGLMVERQIDRIEDAVDDRIVDDRRMLAEPGIRLRYALDHRPGFAR